MTPSRDPVPRGRLDGVPTAVRRLWSLLYRAVRRDAVRVDELTRTVRVQELRLYACRIQVDHLWQRVEELERRAGEAGPP